MNIHCAEKAKMNEVEFYGFVFDKYQDYENHNYNTIIVHDLNNNKRLKLYFILEKSGFFNSVGVKDTLVKKKSDLIIINISQKKEFKLLYNCEE